MKGSQEKRGDAPRSRLRVKEALSTYCCAMGSAMTDRTLLQFPLGSVRFGDLRRSSPIGGNFGYERGTPLDRYYIEAFLARNADAIRGRTLELANNNYTKRFGGVRVEQSDVLSLEATNPNATIVGDLARIDTLPESAFDCIIFTQALQYIYDTAAAVETLYRALKPGGVLLATVPSLTPMGDHPGRDDMEDVWPWFWTFTPVGLRRLLADRFGQNAVAVEAHGNIFVATAFLYGLAMEDLDISDLNVNDPKYPVTVAARAAKRKGI